MAKEDELIPDPGKHLIANLRPEVEGAFALAVYIEGEWVVVAHMDVDIASLAEAARDDEGVPAHVSTPMNPIARAKARIMCKYLYEELHHTERLVQERRRRN